MIPATLSATIQQILDLVEEEASLRERARLLELIPFRREAANRLFARASEVRARRLALVDRCRLS